MVFEDKSAWKIFIVILALFLVFAEPYFFKQTLQAFLFAAAYFGILGLVAIGFILYGIYSFLVTKNSIHFQIGLMILVFVLLISKLPIL